MVQIANKPFSQSTNLNLLDELRVRGNLISSPATNHFTIVSLQDFKDTAESVVGTVITLQVDSEYSIHGDIDIEDFRLVGQSGTQIMGISRELDSITTSNTVTIFVTTGETIIDSLTLRNTSNTTSSAMLSIGTVATPTELIAITCNRVKFDYAGTLSGNFGVISNARGIEFLDCVFEIQTTAGTINPLVINGDSIQPVFRIHNCQFNDQNGTLTDAFFNFKQGTDQVEFDACIISDNILQSDSILAQSTGVEIPFIRSGRQSGVITGNVFGDAEPFVNILLGGASPQWSVMGNTAGTGVQTHFNILSASATTTVANSITALNYFTTIDSSDGFTVVDDSPGPSTATFTPLFEQSGTYLLTFNTLIKIASAQGFTFEVQIGTTTIPGGQFILALTTTDQVFTFSTLVTVNKGDVLRLAGTNQTNSQIVTVTRLNFTASRIA